MINELLKELPAQYRNDKSAFAQMAPPRRASSLRSYQIISNLIPGGIEAMAMLPSTRYMVTGSVGKGNFAEIPWIWRA